MLTVTEAARLLDMPVRTLRSRIEAGLCVADRFGARTLLVSRAEVERQRALVVRRGPRGKHDA